MQDHIEAAAKREYETVMSGTWDNAPWESRVQFYTTSRRIIYAYLESLRDEIEKTPNTNPLRQGV